MHSETGPLLYQIFTSSPELVSMAKPLAVEIWGIVGRWHVRLLQCTIASDHSRLPLTGRRSDRSGRRPRKDRQGHSSGGWSVGWAKVLVPVTVLKQQCPGPELATLRLQVDARITVVDGDNARMEPIVVSDADEPDG
jgi:hypothetical protein